MEKQFIPYEQALELKKLGFDEECFGYYNMINHSGKFKFDIRIWENSDDYIEAPLWQQAFDFFREKYNIDIEIRSYRHTPVKYYECYIDDINNKTSYGGIGKSFTYEEARLECLKYLIKLVKNN